MTDESKSRWPQEWNDELRRLILEERVSFGAAAYLMTQKFKRQFTRNMTIARAHRMGLGGRTPQAQKNVARRKSVWDKPRRMSLPAKITREPRPQQYPRMAERPPETVAERVDGTCQFIDGDDHKKCGAPVSGQTNWCEHHRRLCYQPHIGRPSNPAPMPHIRRW